MQTRVCKLYDKHDIRIETEALGEPGPEEVLVQMSAAGICGSDLHYYHDGGFGPIRVREPIILGHEASGIVAATGKDVSTLAVGDRVAISPSRPCGECEYCRDGMFNHCLNMRFSGSAMRMPHEQGLFRDRMIVPAAQCHRVGDETTMAEAACSEPLAVCLHAARMAGPTDGKRVLVTGAGPIGALCVAVAARAGAAEIVVTDLQDAALAVARKMGATRMINAATNPDAMTAYSANKGYFHTVFECSAAAPAIKSAIAALRPKGTFVQVGVAGDTPVPLNLIVSKEITFQGTHRFHEEFAQAVAAISAGEIDVRPIITATYPLAEAQSAFDEAGDRSRALKVHLSFETA